MAPSPTQVQALQFEWAWQHPEKGQEPVRQAVAQLPARTRAGVAGKIAVLMEMLRVEPWRYYPLTVQFLSSEWAAQRGRCAQPPAHMPVCVAPLEVGAGLAGCGRGLLRWLSVGGDWHCRLSLAH